MLMRIFQIPRVSFWPDQILGVRVRHCFGFVCLLLSACCLLSGPSARAQDPEPPPEPPAEEEEKPLPGDWAVALLDQISNSPKPEVRDELLRAVMRVGPAAVPLLEAGLKDDRTAEFAAQALAFIGGEKALKILWQMVPDPRDLNLRRFSYGALAEFSAPEATETLIQVVKNADLEPDRTVTQTAIVALTVRSDPAVLPPLREALEHIEDIVIRLDLENAIEVIDRRAKQRAAGQLKSGGSIEYAVRGYFSPALGSPPAEAGASTPAPRRSSAQGARTKPVPKPDPQPGINVRIQNIALSPDETRALANVIFEDPTASARYDIVLQKRSGEWVVASVWLGEQTEKVLPKAATPAPPEPTN